MPDPEPTPIKPFSRAWWLRELQLILPTNWRNLVQWLIVWGVAWLIYQLTGKQLPLPEPPFPMFMAVPAGTDLDAEQLEELERRGIKVRFTGWVRPTEEEIQAVAALLPEPRWEMTDAAGLVTGPEDDAPLWRLYSKVARGPPPAHDQGPIGSCVSFGVSLAIEFSLCSKINGKRGPPQEFAPTVREAIYGGSRINADPRNPIRGGDGSTGARAAKWGQKGVGGALPVGSFGEYSVSRCREWGNRGVPAEAVKVCKENPYQSTLVTSAEAARQAIQQGYAIYVCSDVGFGKTQGAVRDADGFLSPRGTWMHCMCIAGYQGGKRPGFLIVNSWGEGFVSGPTGRFTDIPPGSFWADSRVVDRMLKQNDSYAVADVEGFKRRRINPDDWIVRDQHQQPPPHRPLRILDHVLAIAP